MRVESYSFGTIKLNEKVFKNDVIVYGEFVKEWWRREGHRVCLNDVKDILKLRPEVVVIGTGYYGVVKVDRDVIERLRGEGIDVICEESRRAVETYNRLLKEGKKVALAIHLTC